MTATLRSWLVAFARFWYDFIVGDDWTLAAAAVVSLGITALLVRGGITAWWLTPVAAIAVVAASLRRR